MDGTQSLTILIFSQSAHLSDASALAGALRPVLPGWEHEDAGTARKSALRIPWQGKLISVLAIEAPAPLQTTDPEIKNAWYWPEAAAEVGAHKSHLVIGVAGGADGVERAKLMVKLVAALLGGVVANPVAVCNPASGSLLPVAMAKQFLDEPDTVALPLPSASILRARPKASLPSPAYWPPHWVSVSSA